MSAIPFDFHVCVRSVLESESVLGHDFNTTTYISRESDSGPNLALFVSVLCSP